MSAYTESTIKLTVPYTEGEYDDQTENVVNQLSTFLEQIGGQMNKDLSIQLITKKLTAESTAYDSEGEEIPGLIPIFPREVEEARKEAQEAQEAQELEENSTDKNNKH